VLALYYRALINTKFESFTFALKEHFFPPLGDLATNIDPWLKTGWSPYQRGDSLFVVLNECCGWRLVNDPANATIIIGRKPLTLPAPEINPEKMGLRLGKGQLYSRIEGIRTMTDKAALHQLLVKIDATHLQPETYVMGVRKDCAAFFRQAANEPETVWVMKIPGKSQGDGTVVNPDIEELRKEWLVDLEASVDDLECKLISTQENKVAQRYIRNPLLLEGKKMEIRTYWLIACLEPPIVLYHDGTVRLTTTNYSDGDWKNPLKHITNTKQQKLHDPNYHRTEAQRKWSLDQLAEYLEKEGIIQQKAETWLDEYLRPNLKKYIGIVVSGAWPTLLTEKQNPGWDGRFEILGMDVIMDTELRLWLTEIQLGPGISLDPGIKSVLLPIMLEELANIVLEVDRDLREGRQPLNPPRAASSWETVPLFLKNQEQKQNRNKMKRF